MRPTPSQIHSRKAALEVSFPVSCRHYASSPADCRVKQHFVAQCVLGFSSGMFLPPRIVAFLQQKLCCP